MENFEQINKKKIDQYKKDANIENIFIIDPADHKDKIIDHYLKLEKEDLFLRFNTFMTKKNIINYVNFLISKKAILVAYIINEEIIGLCETLNGNDDLAELAITVIKKYRKNKIGKHLLIYSVFLAHDKNHKIIKIDFSRNNRIIFSWAKGFNVQIHRDHSDCYTTFPTIKGNIEKLLNY